MKKLKGRMMKILKRAAALALVFMLSMAYLPVIPDMPAWLSEILDTSVDAQAADKPTVIISCNPTWQYKIGTGDWITASSGYVDFSGNTGDIKNSSGTPIAKLQYTDSTAVLKLTNNFTYSGNGHGFDTGKKAGIYCSGNLILILGSASSSNTSITSSISITGSSSSESYGIYTGGDLTVYNGTDVNNRYYCDTTLSCSGGPASKISAGIYSGGTLYLKDESGQSFQPANGSKTHKRCNHVTLNATGGNVSGAFTQSYDGSHPVSAGIYAATGYVQNSATVTATGGGIDNTGSGGVLYASDGLFTSAYNQSGGTVTVRGGNISKSGSSSGSIGYSAGLAAGYSIQSSNYSGNASVTGGTITATAGNCMTTTPNDFYSVGISVENSSEPAAFSNCTVTATGGGSVNIDNTNGLCSYGVRVTGAVTTGQGTDIKAYTGEKEKCQYHRAFHVGGTLTMNGGEIYAESKGGVSESRGLIANTIIIPDGKNPKITGKAGKNRAVWANDWTYGIDFENLTVGNNNASTVISGYAEGKTGDNLIAKSHAGICMGDATVNSGKIRGEVYHSAMSDANSAGILMGGSTKTLTVNGGTVEAVYSGKYGKYYDGAFAERNGGNLVINGGTVTFDGGKDGYGFLGGRTDNNQFNKGTLIIKGGKAAIFNGANGLKDYNIDFNILKGSTNYSGSSAAYLDNCIYNVDNLTSYKYLLAKSGTTAAAGITDKTMTQAINNTSVSASVSDTLGSTAGTIRYVAGEPVVTGTSHTTTVSNYTVDSKTGAVTATLDNTKVGDVVTLPVSVRSENFAPVTRNVKVTLEGAPLTNAVITLGTQKTYSGSSQDVVITSVTVGGATLTKGTDYTITSGGSATDVGNVTLKITGKGNYAETASKTWSLRKKTPAAGDFNNVTATTNRSYTGSQVSVTTPALKSAYSGAGAVTVYYTGTDGTVYAKSATPPVNSGKYAVTFNVAPGNNFNKADDLTYGTLNINKASYGGTKTAAGRVPTASPTVDAKLTLPSIPDGAYYDTASVTYSGIVTAASVENGILTFSTRDSAADSEGTVTIPVKNATNYEDYNVTVTITSVAKNMTPVTIHEGTGSEPATELSKTIGLDSAEFTLIAEPETAGENGSFTWSSDNASVAEVDSEGNVSIKSAGNTIIRAEYSSDSTMGAGTVSLKVEMHEHTLIHHPYKAPTDTEAGNIEYWECEGCHRLYSDSEGNNEIKLEDTVIPALGEKKIVDKVPLTGSNKYASSNDNFAPVADSGKINKLKLDFSNVSKSDVKPTDLKMTVIKGSKFTTEQKLQDASGASGSGGIKVKVNKKTLIPTISCKSDGSATLTMDDGVTYTVAFTVQKPKADKSMKKMPVASEGSAPVIRSIRELFSTDIDSGDLKVTKGSHATVSENVLVIDPTAKDSMKVEYQYLNKKFKTSIKIK